MPPDAIPPDLWEAILRLRPVLEREGIVQPRPYSRTSGWRLRYREPDDDGVLVHRSLLLPGETAAEFVADLISTWREEKRKRERQARELDDAEDEARRLDRLAPEARWMEGRSEQVDRQRAVIARLANGSRRDRRRALHAFDTACSEGIREVFRFVMLQGWEPGPKSKGGRPKTRSGLW